MRHIDIVLVEPKTPGNVGAIARSMGNFDFENLVIINPQCDIMCDEALIRSKHAKHIIENATVVDSIDYLDNYELSAATTAKLGNSYNIKRLFVTPKEFKEKLPENGKVALVFGPEGEGLRNHEIDKCDFCLHIPVSEKYRALNLSHAVNIILYEMFDAKPKLEYIEKDQKDLMMDLVKESLDKIGINDEKKVQKQLETWQQLLPKAAITKREAYVLISFLKHVVNVDELYKNKKD